MASALLSFLGTLGITQAISGASPMTARLGAALLAGFFIALWIPLRLVLMVPIPVIERCGVVAAARRSWALTRGRVLTILGLSFVLALAWLVPDIVSMQVRHVGSTFPHHFEWLAAVSQTVMMPWLFACVAVLHHDARVQHDDVNSRRIAEDATPG